MSIAKGSHWRTDIITSDIVHLYHNEHKSIREIAQQYHCDPKTITRHLDQAGISQKERHQKSNSRRHKGVCRGAYKVRRGNNPNGLQCITCGCCPRTSGRRVCNSCKHSFAHGFKSHTELDLYLSVGCWIIDCNEPAIGIDHDHSICAGGQQHSCNNCRRGPICNRHNNILRDGYTSDDLNKIADDLDQKATATRQAAKALSEWEQRGNLVVRVVGGF